MTRTTGADGGRPVAGFRQRPLALVFDAPALRLLPLSCRNRLMPAPRRLSGLTRAWMAEVRMPAVVLALFSAAPDVWTIAAHLTAIGYRGRVLALAPPLPDRAMVEAELRAAFPALRLRVIIALSPGARGLHGGGDRQ